MRFQEKEKEITPEEIEKIKNQLYSYYPKEEVDNLKKFFFKDLNWFITDEILNTAKEIWLDLHWLWYIAHMNDIWNYKNDIYFIKETSEKYNIDANLIIREWLSFGIHNKTNILISALEEWLELWTTEFRDFVIQQINLKKTKSSVRNNALWVLKINSTPLIPEWQRIESLNLDKTLIEIEKNFYLIKINDLKTNSEKKEFLEKEFQKISGAKIWDDNFELIVILMVKNLKIKESYQLKAIKELLEELKKQ